jgi:sulfur carrier protein
MRVRINGNEVELRRARQARDALVSVGVSIEAVAVAVNRTVVPRGRQTTHRLSAGDEIEIVRAVGGG